MPVITVQDVRNTTESALAQTTLNGTGLTAALINL